jgi:predicted Na+-dependent transporter
MALPLININFLLNIVLALIMFGLGLSLKKEDFQQLFDQPKSLAIG